MCKICAECSVADNPENKRIDIPISSRRFLAVWEISFRRSKRKPFPLFCSFSFLHPKNKAFSCLLALFSLRWSSYDPSLFLRWSYSSGRELKRIWSGLTTEVERTWDRGETNELEKKNFHTTRQLVTLSAVSCCDSLCYNGDSFRFTRHPLITQISVSHWLCGIYMTISLITHWPPFLGWRVNYLCNSFYIKMINHLKVTSRWRVL